MGWHPNPGPYKNDEELVLETGISTYRVPGKCMAEGELRDIVASKAPLIVDGKIVGLVGSFDDVTKEKRQDEEIQKLNADLEKTGREPRSAHERLRYRHHDSLAPRLHHQGI